MDTSKHESQISITSEVMVTMHSPCNDFRFPLLPPYLCINLEQDAVVGQEPRSVVAHQHSMQLMNFLS